MRERTIYTKDLTVSKYIINNNIEIQKDKTWLQAISFLSWLIAIMLTFLNIIPTWVKLKNLDAHMLYYLWFVLFAISLIIIYFLSEIMKLSNLLCK
ncbi:hypothetical protein A3P31_04495 [Lactobacillus johnsonii]|nr:hypothetical protein A3P31_04495 [Lactobacillus johnsonii]